MVATYGPSLPGIETRFGVADSVAGLIVTAQFLGGCLGIAAFGLTHARWTVAQRFSVATPLFGLGIVAASAAPVFPLLLLAVLVSGCGAGGIVVLINFSFATNYGRRSPAMLGLVNAFYGAGSFVGPALVGVAAGYAPVLAGGGAIGLLCLVPLRRTPDGPAPALEAQVAGGAARRLILAFAVLLFLYTGVETGVATWEATDLVGAGWSVQGAAIATSAYWGAFTIARFLGSPLSLRVAPERILVPLLLVAILVLLAIRAHVIPPSGLIAVGLCAGPVFPVVVSWLARVVPNAPSAVTYAILGAILGSAVLPAGLGGLIGIGGLDALPLGLVAYAAACFAMVVFIATWRPAPGGVSARPE